MIRLTRCTQASKAGKYFRDHFAPGDHQASPTTPPVTMRAFWVGPGLADVGLVSYSQPQAKHLVRLGRGLHPEKNVRLAPAKNRKRAYYDLTISPPKTISLAALICSNHSTARNVVEAHKRAVDAVVRQVSTMLTGRTSTAPKVERWMAAVFTHTHTREGEPHLHSHVVIPNIGRNVENHWRAIQIDIAGLNRSRLELVYGNELAMGLQKLGFGPHLTIRANGLPEIRPLRSLVARFSTATRNVLAAAAAADLERPPKRKAAKWEGELHPRSGIPVPPNTPAMVRRRFLADQMRRPKPPDADDPQRLKDESDRWKRALENQEYRSLVHLLDDLDRLNPKRVRVPAPLPPPADLVVKAAYARLDIDQRTTPALLLRATLAESAGRHPYGVLQRACTVSLEARRVMHRKIREELAERHHKARRAKLRNQGAQGIQPVSQAPTLAVAPPPRAPSTPASSAAPSRGKPRR